MTAGRVIDVLCMVEIEQTPESFHAHAIPQGIEILPGDRVFVHGAPYHVDFGSRISVPCRATVIRAGWLERVWTEAKSLFELTELYEVGFESRETR